MTTPVDPFAAMEARRAEQVTEWGTYAAAVQIWSGPALAFDIGHPVPASHVDPSDLSVVTVRHYCPPDLPGQPKCTTPNNEVVSRTGPNAVVKVAKDSAPKQSAKKES